MRRDDVMCRRFDERLLQGLNDVLSEECDITMGHGQDRMDNELCPG